MSELAFSVKKGAFPTNSTPVPILRRKCACEGNPEVDEEQAGVVRRLAVDPSRVTAIPPIVRQVLASPGRPLEPDVRGGLETRFGFDFGRVRIHTDEQAARSARAVNALAYTVGSDLVFGADRYAPHSPAGQRLLAHELAHVVQQGGAMPPMRHTVGMTPAVQQGGRLQPEGRISQPGDPDELQADRMAAGLDSAPGAFVRGAYTPAALQRQSPRPAPVDANAQRIIDLAQDTSQPMAQRAAAVLRAIIDQYFPGDASKVSAITYNTSRHTGLLTTYVGRGASTTGSVDVADDFVTETVQRNFARRVLQVRHEIEHIEQVRGGMAGPARSDEREFIAFYHEALATELPGTGRMQHSSRVNLIDAALGYYYCLSAELQSSNTSRRDELVTRRTEEVRHSGRSDFPATPTSCNRQPI